MSKLTAISDLAAPLSSVTQDCLQAWADGLDAQHRAALSLLADACRVALADEPSPGMMPDCSVNTTEALFDFVDTMSPTARQAVAVLRV